MTAGKRLKKARDYVGLTQSEFAEQFSLKWDKIKNIETETHKLNPDFAEMIEKKYSISGWWLLTGKGDMLLNKDSKLQNETNSNLVNISYFKDTYAAAGAGAINFDKAPMVMAFDKDFLKVQLGITVFKHLHIIHAIGNSMYPTIQTGEMLFVNPFENEEFKIRDKDIYVINTPNGVLVKRIKIHPIKPIYILVSDNPQDEDITLEGDDFKACTIIGRVIGHFNKL
ncbi:LexA family transcriptional regulator [Aliarcobacter butzleri]|uniref:LexA family transcriptional regulator n=1 Tax=Aliarcobacter butzleri TaxID=28197 RepID=UPI002B24FB81|nr:S24 family peptidase [Aliarcobacter butzleri]